ncbi:hypothetical protein VSU19_01385 [Verrucomicrobiales bacterium BCK34]|nr:hypothetical protein [Verrucomicrobiales bacterium BCK34]
MKHDTHRVELSMQRLVAILITGFGALLFSSCTTTSATTSTTGPSGAGQLSASKLNNPAVKARDAQIAMEAPGDYYIGRRWWTDGTRFWGYLRKPRQPWSEAKLVIMNETISKQPDRIPEEGMNQRHGYDHNYEYRIWGSFVGGGVYDPNSNFIVPEFRITKYELISENPGFLFYPGEEYSPRHLPIKHPPFP